MEIRIPEYISSSSYFFEKENSRCYVINEKTHQEHLFEGISADLWKIILETSNYDCINQYALERGVQSELKDFLLSLQKLGLIKINEKEFPYFLGTDSLPVDNCEKNLQLFLSEKYKWLYQNNFLPKLAIELSYKCNLNCVHCYNDKNIPNESIDFEIAKNIIDDAIKIGVSEIQITSGECTINSNFIKIARYIREKKIPFSFVTNGQVLSDNDVLFDEIVKLYPHRVRVSLYSMNADIHDSITGVKGSHQKTVTAIKKLREKDIVVTINYFQMSLNNNSFDDVLRFQNEVGAEIAYDLYFLNNKSNNNSSVMVTNSQVYDLYSDSLCLFSAQLNHIKNNLDFDNQICQAGKYLLSISPTLDICPCISLKYVLGNLKNTTLFNVWNEKMNEFREKFQVRNLKECNNSDYCEYCFYCPAMGFLENGFMKKSDICCELAKIRMNILRKV
ncbi:MAG: radical SAM protein [Candidatus Gastranaerophilales bacterium]|nr:radical SAM protein [Candidatus Gastranaerophilales bacterium]